MDWATAEAEIERVLPPHARAVDRQLLLARLESYAAAVVAAARGCPARPPGESALTTALTWLRRPVLVCGSHRSGTTLMQSLLDAHPQLVVIPSEGTYFTSFRYAARQDASAAAMDRFAKEWVVRCVAPNSEPHFHLGRSTFEGNPSVAFVRALLDWHARLRDRLAGQGAEFAPLMALAAAFQATVAPARAPQRWVEKTPMGEFTVKRFLKFPQARFIHMVRNPVATLASLQESYRNDRVPYDRHRHMWAIRRSLECAHRNAKHLGARYLVVRYEDLTADPQAVMRRVADFLQIPTHPTLCIPTAGGAPVRANSSFDPGAPGVVEHRPRDSTPPPLPELRLISAFVGRPAGALGYALPPPGLPSRVHCAVRTARLAAAEFLRGARQAATRG